MKPSPSGLAPVAGYLSERLLVLPAFQDPEQPPRTMPVSPLGKRIRYNIKEYEPLLDSCNMTHRDWARIAEDIKENYDAYDGFVVLHGTDTMAFTCSVLSFMLINLNKTVILTGSQIPLCQQRNDGESNLLAAMTIAGHYQIPEVCLFFCNKLLRGCRSTKRDASALDAFDSPNYPALAHVEIDYDIAWEKMLPTPVGDFTIDTRFEQNVSVLTLFPGMKPEVVESQLRPPMKGVVLRAFGAGNAPDNNKPFLEVLRKASERGVVIVAVTQCFKGAAAMHYATGVALHDAGVVSCADITMEAALTKLGHLLGQGLSPRQARKEMTIGIRGEMTIQSGAPRFALDDRSFIQSVYRALMKGVADDEAERHLQLIRDALSPVLLCSAAGTNDVVQLDSMVKGGSDVNQPDYDHRTPLHVAACEGRVEAVKFLLAHGANVGVVDRWGGTPLYDAVRQRHFGVIRQLERRGAKLSDEEHAKLLHTAVRNSNMEDLAFLVEHFPTSVTLRDADGRTALHVAVAHRQPSVIEYLLENGADPSAKDVFGVAAIDAAGPAIEPETFTMKAGHIHSGVETDDVSDCTSPLVGMSSLPPRRTTLIGSFASGALATSCSAILTNPMEVAKTRLQLSGELNRVSSAQYKGVFDALTKIWKFEGLRGLQAGLAPMVAFQVAMNGTRLGLYPSIESAITTKIDAGSHPTVFFAGKMVAGATAGAIGAFLGSPMFMVKCRLQAQSSHFQALEKHSYNGLLDGLRKIYTEGGLAGLYHGSRALILRVSCGSAAQLSSYDTTKSLVLTHTGAHDGVAVHIVSSLVAGFMATTVMSPLDVVSTRIYNQRAGHYYTGILNCLVKTVQAEGLTALWKGWIAQYMRLGPHTVITFLLWEQFKRLVPF